MPMVDDLALDYVTWIHHRTAPRAASLPVAGLEGDAQQMLGRTSHDVQLAGVMVGDEAHDSLTQIQKKAATGEEVTFHSDVTTALEVEHMIVVEAQFAETAGRPGHYEYFLNLRESPPLPPPAELDPFGGLGGIGELGFEGLADVLDDISDLANQVQGAIDAVNDAISQLEALTRLADLSLESPVAPIQAEGEKLAGITGTAEAVVALSDLLGGA